MDFHTHEHFTVMQEVINVAVDDLRDLLKEYDHFKKTFAYFKSDNMIKPVKCLIINAFVQYNKSLYFHIKNCDTQKYRNIPFSDIIPDEA